MHPLLYYYYYIALLLPYCPPRSLPCNLTSDTPPPSRPRGRDILPSHPQVLLSRVATSHFQVLVPLIFRAGDVLNSHPQVSVSQGRDIPLSLPPATFQEGILTTDVFKSLPQWHALMCASVKDVWYKIRCVQQNLAKDWSNRKNRAIIWETVTLFREEHPLVNLYYAKPCLQMILISLHVDVARTSERGIMIWRGLSKTSIIGYSF